MPQRVRGTRVVCGALSCLGVTAAIFWCELMGHTPGFLLATAGLGTWANARVFWLIGILLMSLVFIVSPRASRKADTVFRYTIPILGVLGAGCFALSFHQSFFDPKFLAATGLIVSGFSYFWFVSRYALFLSLSQGLTTMIWAFAIAFPLKQVSLIVVDTFIIPDSQVLLAIAMPLISALLFELACFVAKRNNNQNDRRGEVVKATLKPRSVFGVVTLPKSESLNKEDQRFLGAVVIATALLLSVVRACGLSGAWGDDHTLDLDIMGAFTTALITLVGLSLYAYFALIRMNRNPVTMRFQLAILLVVAGLFLAAFQAQYHVFNPAFIEVVILIDNPFAWLLFWTSIAIAVDALERPVNAIAGFAGAIYASASIVWVMIIDGGNAASSAFILVAAYMLFAMFLGWSWLAQRSALRKSHAMQTDRAGIAQGVSDYDGMMPSNEYAQDSGAALVGILEKRCEELSHQHRLSQREKAVFLLLAQGRTGTAIQQELQIAGSTVKTHTQHIYKKLGVSDRQELMDMVLNIPLKYDED